jgi:hypothetical protein
MQSTTRPSTSVAGAAMRAAATAVAMSRNGARTVVWASVVAPAMTAAGHSGPSRG